MKIKFENGSEIKTIECGVKARPSNTKVVVLDKRHFFKKEFDELWDSLNWFQKKILMKEHETQKRHTLCCPMCGTTHTSSYIPIMSRGIGKTYLELNRFLRYMCCSDECFVELWSAIWEDAEQ